MPLPADLDHVAVAAHRTADLWPCYAGDLGGAWVGGGDTAGFYSAQVQFANGMKVEGLEPRRVDENDFLARFLAANGPGPHHLTFKVPDIHAALVELAVAGYEPINVNLAEPSWMEAFLHPKTAHGIVVQVAQSSGAEWGEPAPDGLPAPRVAVPATLDVVTHLVADLAAARHLFGTVLGGTAVAEEHGAVLLAWPGPGRVRLVQPEAGTPEAAWLGARVGRLHHLGFTVATPDRLAAAVVLPDGTVEVPPEANQGVRLRLTPA